MSPYSPDVVLIRILFYTSNLNDTPVVNFHIPRGIWSNNPDMNFHIPQGITNFKKFGYILCWFQPMGESD